MKKFLISLILAPVCLFATTKVSVVGDSITWGAYANDNKGYCDMLQARYIAEGKDVIVINKGLPGGTSDNGVILTNETIANDQPDYLVLTMGINDAALNLDPTRLMNNFIYMANMGNLHCKKVLIGGVDPSRRNAGYAQALANVYIHLMYNMGVQGFYFLTPDIVWNHSPDTVHPDQNGHLMIMESLYQALKVAGVQ